MNQKKTVKRKMENKTQNTLIEIKIKKIKIKIAKRSAEMQ